MSVVDLHKNTTRCPKKRDPSYLKLCGLRLTRKVTGMVAKVIPKLFDNNGYNDHGIYICRPMSLVSNVSVVMLSTVVFFLFSLVWYLLLFGGMFSKKDAFSNGDFSSFQEGDENGNSGMTLLFPKTATVMAGTIPIVALSTITEELSRFFNSLIYGDEWYVDWWLQLGSPLLCAADTDVNPSSQTKDRPAVLTFAVLVDVRVDAVLESIDGILAAFNEANTSDILGGTKVGIDVFDVGHLVDQVLIDGKLNVKSLNSVFRSLLNNIVNPTAASSKRYYGIIDLTDTLLEAYMAVYPTAKDFLFITTSPRQYKFTRKDTIFFKPNKGIERRHLLQIMLHGYDVSCAASIFFLNEDATSTAINTIRNQFTYSHFREPTIIIRQFDKSNETNNELYRRSVTEALRSFGTSCIVIDDTIEATDTLLKDLSTGKYGEFNREKYGIFAPSWSIKQGAASYPSYFKGVFSVHLLPDNIYAPDLAQAFLTSFKSFRGDSKYTKPIYISSQPSVNHGVNDVSSSSPTSAAYFGYFIGAFLSNVARLSFNLDTPEALFKTVYVARSFRIHNFAIGPFTNGCVRGVLNSCFCNIGMKSIYTSVIDPSSLSMKTVFEADSDLQASTLTISSDVCMSVDSFPTRRAYLSLVPREKPVHQKSDQSTIFGSPTFTQIIKKSLVIHNRNNAQNNKYLVQLKEIEVSDHITEDEIRSIGDNLRPFLLFQNDHYGVVTEGSLTLTRRSSEWRIKEEPFNPTRLILEPSLGDAIHANLAAMKDFAKKKKDFTKGMPKVFLLAETEEQLELMKASAAALGISVSDSKVIGSTEEERVKREVRAAANAVRSEGSGVSYVHYASQSVTFALDVATTRENLFLFLSTPERAIEVANKSSKILQAGTPFAKNTKVFFATVFGRWWYPTSGLHKVIVRNLKAFGSTVNVLHSEVTAVQAALSALVRRFLVDASFNIGPGSNALDALTPDHRIYIPGVMPIGPLNMKECANKADAVLLNRDCSCNKAFRRLMVAEVGEWLTMSPQTYFGDLPLNGTSHYYNFEYVMNGCGLDYTATQTSWVNVEIIAGVGVVLFLIFIGAFVFVYRCVGRSHANAPKDSTKPFSVVFTDIESSTALWSRAPSAMSLSINEHHRLIRKQIKVHRGYEVKTIGDSFMVAFKNTEDAVAFSVGIQRSLFANDWPNDLDYNYRSIALERAGETNILHPIYLDENIEDYKKLWNGIRVRVGIHYGFGEIKKNDVSNGYDYYGAVVDIAARVEGIGHGGQVLITQDVLTTLSETFLSNTIDSEVISLKEQTLKGLEFPVHLYQVMPHELRDRHFNDLRLYVENVVEETQGEKGESCSSSHYQKKSSGKASLNEGLTPESIAEKLELQHRNAFYREDLLKFYNFLKFANTSSTLKKKEDIISHWGKKWNVDINKTNKTEKANDVLMRNSLEVLAKITAAYYSDKTKGNLKRRSRTSGASGMCSFQDSLVPYPCISDQGKDCISAYTISSPSVSEGAFKDGVYSHEGDRV